MSRSQAFYARVLSYHGIETTMHVDPWRTDIPKVENISNQVGMRVISKVIVDPNERNHRTPRSKLERWLDSISRGTNINLSPETTETRGSHFLGAIEPVDDFSRSKSRAILDISGLGIIPELEDQKVLVQARCVMLHHASMSELENGIFINNVKLTPYIDADPTRR